MFISVVQKDKIARTHVVRRKFKAAQLEYRCFKVPYNVSFFASPVALGGRINSSGRKAPTPLTTSEFLYNGFRSTARLNLFVRNEMLLLLAV
jgi:hypothetical protein